VRVDFLPLIRDGSFEGSPLALHHYPYRSFTSVWTRDAPGAACKAQDILPTVQALRSPGIAGGGEVDGFPAAFQAAADWFWVVANPGFRPRAPGLTLGLAPSALWAGIAGCSRVLSVSLLFCALPLRGYLERAQSADHGTQGPASGSGKQDSVLRIPIPRWR
jgi:hypothetical protein